ncbi:flagellar basal-body rod protein FlgG [Halanaerobium congolense]|jgi:flagellar basal-body rod protein FlgG|uniref:Flagellar basal-body rod protein FlgG n=1 Tax=Halanaerobium congolense TaxID=54121 RepID=A0A1G6RIC3_9FIRM|nr:MULTISPECIES: flagellar basal-body rod protein FlgF [Halanaerobium]KXS49941.1 MAG: flagellar basal-body rod protein FlgG [Halanaerobium sp. T82-1]OEG61779.1 MAG: flagellar basal-body rod protein FlgF [Halanaerobium sp. MDAL1]PTX16536.1 flagellar basal-body rod protein FlgG [Halanaerobium congolense]PUU92296.1 MAG: flagellar basal-body rod protein FlgG [Halanaerobium sp.]PUU92505.1 MAG: Flagellar basal-body rod protein FlgF [Halanaerobium sp.]
MIKGLYTAASSMGVLEKKSNIRANNLANSNTTGFKKSGTVTSSFPEMLLERIEAGRNSEEIGEISTGAFLERSFKDMRQGDLQRTNNKLDLAIQGEGFFTIETEAGIRYSRDGNFTINNNSELVTQSGNPVLDINGERIQLIADEDFSIDQNGVLRFNNGLQGSQIALVNFENSAELIQQGDNLYLEVEESNGSIASEAVLAQGYLETSNVKIVEEMVQMIKTSRHYESNQKVITTMDESLSKVINEVGKA